MKRTIIMITIILALTTSVLGAGLGHNFTYSNGNVILNITGLYFPDFTLNNETGVAGGGTVTSVSGDGKYVLGTITTSGTFTFNETQLNATIDARGGSGDITEVNTEEH